MDTVIKKRLELTWPKNKNERVIFADDVDDLIEQLQQIPEHILNTHDLELINTEKDLRAKAIRRIVKRYYEVTVTVH